MVHVVVANWRAKEGADDEVAGILTLLTPLVRQEPGCLHFVGTRSPSDPRRFLIYEEYVDEQAFEAHRATDHFAHLVQGRAIPLLEDRSVDSYRTVEANGGPAADAPAGARWGRLPEAERAVRLLLLRHGQMASHEGDMPLTAEGEETARLAGKLTAAPLEDALLVLSSDTKRTRQSADLFAETARQAGTLHAIDGPRVASALRNPDLYLAGSRVDMVSTPEALAQQVPELTPADCAAHPFFSGFMAAPDRIGWWLRHPAPPGDGPAAVTARIMGFARSLADQDSTAPLTVAAITHSPILRAVSQTIQGTEPGEPPYLTGLSLDIALDGEIGVDVFDPFGG